MSAAPKMPKTLIEAVRHFSDLAVAHEFMVATRWPAGVCCPRCGSVEVQFISTRRTWRCKSKHESRTFSVKTGTIMEDSPLGLDKWMVALWLECNAKNSISSYELHRALGITQKSAWFMQQRIRLAMQTGSIEKIGGKGSDGVEADETFIGGKLANMHAKRRKRFTGTGGLGTGKTAVMGLLERHSENGSRVRAEVITTTNRKTMHAVVRKHVAPGAKLFTDAHSGYVGMTEFTHAFVDHAERYVNGVIHTNGLENFWSLFKRCIKGTHVAVEPFHLFRYVDAQAFRFNNRKLDDAGRFMAGAIGFAHKRLTYKSLIGQDHLEGDTKSQKDEGTDLC